MTIGEKIKLARSLVGMTSKELAFLSGISEGQIRQYEINTRVPRKGKLESIASALGVQKEFFLEHNMSTNTEVMHSFFELYFTRSAHVFKTDSSNIWETYTLAFDDSNIYKQLEEWYKEQELFTSGKISKDDYENWQLKYPLSLADDWKIKINNYHKISKNATIKNDPTDQKLNVILKLIVDKFSVCKNMDEVAEAVQDIKDMISK